MQSEFADDFPELSIQILAVNESGHESGCDGMSALGDIPLLQDTEVDAVWDSWDVTYRDVIILDELNEKVAVFNLTTYSLSVEENYSTLRALLTTTAESD
jgi:hypothetical protein